MFNFDFYNPTRILFGKDKIEEMGSLIPKDAKVLITYGGGSAKKNGIIDKAKSVLKSNTVFEFSGIEPNPNFETLMKAVEIVRKEKIDFILAIGGGSVIDGTKFISLASYYEGDETDLLKFGFMPITSETVKKAVPLGSVLTLPATGSEMNSGAVITYNHGKFPVMSPLAFPVFSVLDPTYTFTLPKIQVANGIADAFIHTLEQYITYPVDARVQDRWAEGILHTLIETGETSVNEPENYDARANHMWSATMALNGIIAAGVPQDWATHMIGHELTAMFGIDHGQTLAVVYPALMEVRRDQKREKLIQYAERIWNIEETDQNKKINLAIERTRGFFESLGIKTRLSEYGVKEEQLSDVVEQLKAHGMTALSETQDITPEISLKILQTAM
ncbi:MAG: iron-containing alcohol dehydrogenase [Desulforegulaceae bacterium]|nr:iron-containing alcohol dehydrogenase [Desulforegulaceae bacterium]